MMKTLFAALLVAAEWAWLNAGMRPTISFRVSDEPSDKECNAAIDMVFLLDGSYSVRDEDWEGLKKFVSETVERFTIGPDHLEVGFVQYTHDARIEMRFNDSAEGVAQGLVNLDQKGGNTNLSDGLIKSRELFEDHERKARRILVVVSDGDVDSYANAKARSMESDLGVLIFSVAVGEDADVKELKNISSGGRLFFEVSQYSILDKIVGTISKQSCHIVEQVTPDTKVADIAFGTILGEEDEDTGGHSILPSSPSSHQQESASENSVSLFASEDEEQASGSSGSQDVNMFASEDDEQAQQGHTESSKPAKDDFVVDEKPAGDDSAEVAKLRKRVSELEELYEEAKAEDKPCPHSEDSPVSEGMLKDLEKNQQEMMSTQETMQSQLMDQQKDLVKNQEDMLHNQENIESQLQDQQVLEPATPTTPTTPAAVPTAPQESEAPVNEHTTSEEPAIQLTTESQEETDNFKGGELQDEEAEVNAVTTEVEGKCYLEEMATKFLPVFEGWLLLNSLGKRLLWEELGSVLATFRKNVASTVPKLARIGSDMTFARTFGSHLVAACAEVNFTQIQILKVEYMDFKNLGLADYVYRVEGKEKERLEGLQSDLCLGMREFLKKVKGVEKGTPEVKDPTFLWHMWQESWGAVRIFIKVTTQCRIQIPKGADPSSFMTRDHQDEWKKCVGAIDFPTEQFPSAVMSCARSDEEIDVRPYKGKDRNRVVRYFGCGKNRVKMEPPVEPFVTKNCAQTSDPDVRDFMFSMCANGAISTGACRLYGPFWGIYSHPAEDLYGYHSFEEKQQCLAKVADGAPASEQCAEPQAVAFTGQFNRAMADYIYGTPPPLTHSRSRAWQDGKKDLGESGWDPSQMMYSLPQDRKLDPPLWEMLREAEVGEGMMMISYGYSGAGKTTTLIGDATAPVGGGRGIDGVLSLYLKENAAKIEDVHVKIFEVYGRVGAQDGYMKAQTGSGIWAYRLRERTAVYLGQSTAFEEDSAEDEPSSGNLNMTRLENALDNDAYTFSIKEESPPAMSGVIAWHEQVKEVLTTIEDIRLDEDQFKAGGEPIAHIRGTVNNPKSSRGTLFVLTNIFKNGKMAPISTVDLAGSEDPAVMVSGFLRFMNREGVSKCDPENGKTPTDLMAKYLASLSSWEEMSTELSWCYELRDVLEECDTQKPARGCVYIYLESGVKQMVRPKLDKPTRWIGKNSLGVDLPETYVHKVGKKSVKFRFEEIMEAKAAGTPPHLGPKRTETNPLGEAYAWIERLWSRCSKAKGTEGCVGVIDNVLLGVKNPREYTDQSKGDKGNPLVEVPRILTVSKGGADKGKWQEGGSLAKKVDMYKDARAAFFNGIKDFMVGYEAKENNEEFDRHLRYFTSAIGPIVEEAFFINEALNDMKGYLGIWAKTSQKSPPGTLLSLWPPKDFEVKGKINQVVDYSDGSKISEQGYKIYNYIKPKDAAESYAQQLAHGQDGIMLVTMLEYIRRLSVRRGKNTKVLVGTFIRSDIPGADLDCEGARASLEFAQDLSDMVGWNRGLPGVLPHFHPR